MKRLALVTMTAWLVAAAPASAATLDFGRQTWNILPPGQSGALPPDAHSTDQIPRYDRLTALFNEVRPRDIRRTYKSARFYAPRGGPVLHPRPGVRIRTDRRWGVPHITGRTRSDVFFGIGWATARDRGKFMELIRYPARLAVVDAPGYSAQAVATSLRRFTPSRQTETFLRRETKLVRRAGARGRRILRDVRAFVAGVNAFNSAANNGVKPWTYTDVTAVTGLLGQIFGAGGGREVRNSMLLGELRNRFGPAGDAIWRDLRSANDPDRPVTTRRSFPYVTERGGSAPGSLVADPGSMSSSALHAARVLEASRARASNALLIGRKRSATGHPLAVMGPQLGYYYPELFMEVDAHGGGIDVRGGLLPGLPYVMVGRGPDYAWSATSANNDIVDQFLEELCNQDGTPATRGSDHYMYMGICRPMKDFFAGTLAATSTEPEKQVSFKETVHGPVSGTVTVQGKPYAIANLRSTRGRESTAAFIGDALNSRVHSQRDFRRAASHFGLSFNMFYVDDRDIAFVSGGRLPVRAPGTNPSLPTLGTGAYDWRGFLAPRRHPQAVNPGSGVLRNWNGATARDFGASDSNWSNQSVDRSDLLRGNRPLYRLVDVLRIVNTASTQDLRAVRVWPVILRVLAGGPSPDERSQRAVNLVTSWMNTGASRLDRDLDGKIDDPGAAVLDQSWDSLAQAVLSPVLGDLAVPGGALDRLETRDQSPRSRNGIGSSYDDGWYGFVRKDLKTLLGEHVRAPYSRRYCGNGNLAACRESLWAVIQSSADALAASQGTDPSAWRSDATAERIRFAPGVLDATMRWANRPTFHQLMEFDGHR